MMAIKDKLIKCVARNIAKERYGDSSKSDEFLIEAELLLKHLFYVFYYHYNLEH